MYYHARELKYVVYDKVAPAPTSAIDEGFLNAYKWLGKHCGYCPQIWLSRSKSILTGYKNKRWIREKRFVQSNIMFGFDIIKGFPVKFDTWELIMCSLMNNESLRNFMNSFYNDLVGENIKFDYYVMPVKDYVEKGEEYFLKTHLFVEHDQIVVPSLNLKSAKTVFCRNEKEYKKLVQMGFIKDRIHIQK